MNSFWRSSRFRSVSALLGARPLEDTFSLLSKRRFSHIAGAILSGRELYRRGEGNADCKLRPAPDREEDANAGSGASRRPIPKVSWPLRQCRSYWHALRSHVPLGLRARQRRATPGHRNNPREKCLVRAVPALREARAADVCGNGKTNLGPASFGHGAAQSSFLRTHAAKA